MRILLFATAYNGLCQRIHRELISSRHQISIELSDNPDVMHKSFLDFAPQLIICPFLKHRVPDNIWQQVPCLILHPGIAGDKGPSSLDWAIVNRTKNWGATLLQANHDFDAGAIWATSEFPMRATTKASTYRREINRVAAQMIVQSVNQLSIKKQITYMSNRSVAANEQHWRPLMKQASRQINWQQDSSETVLDKINAADSFPGVRDEINGTPVYLFGARLESINTSGIEPGTLIGQKDEAICRATKDGAIWIRQLKQTPSESQSFFKLPAMRVLSAQKENTQLLAPLKSEIQSDIRVEIKNQVAYLYFDFYNGAFNSEQCRELLNQFRVVAGDPGIKVVALMGGEDFWSNGIHLNCIENAKDPAQESWRNINAINDFAEAVINCQSVVTVAALRNNAGAGGAILPLACDYVIARDGVVLNPHYQTMGLTGSEYWTYLLPRRVGHKKAQELTQACLPVLAKEALAINLVDNIFTEEWNKYHQELKNYCETLAHSEDYVTLLEEKIQLRLKDEIQKPLSAYRVEELKKMRAIFNDPKSSYHRLRYNFVHKISCGKTPERLRTQVPVIDDASLNVG